MGMLVKMMEMVVKCAHCKLLEGTVDPHCGHLRFAADYGAAKVVVGTREDRQSISSGCPLRDGNLTVEYHLS